MKKIMTSDVIEWVDGVSNTEVLKDILTVVRARLIHIEYLFDDEFPL